MGGLPLALRCMAEVQARGDVIVSVGEDCSGDLDCVAEHALGGIAAVVDRWLDLFDDNSLAGFGRLHALFNSFAISGSTPLRSLERWYPIRVAVV